MKIPFPTRIPRAIPLGAALAAAQFFRVQFGE